MTWHAGAARLIGVLAVAFALAFGAFSATALADTSVNTRDLASNVSTDDVAWDDVAWDDVAWDDVAWDDVAWDDVAWDDSGPDDSQD